MHIDELSPFSKHLLGEMVSTFTKSKALICDHSSQKDYLNSLNMLRFIIDMGVNIEKINFVYRFKDFLEKNIEVRKNASSDFEKEMGKFIYNSISGNCLSNLRLHQINTKFVTNTKEFQDLLQIHS